MGQFSSTLELAALGPNTVIFNLASYLFFSVGLSTNTLVGRFLKEGACAWTGPVAVPTLRALPRCARYACVGEPGEHMKEQCHEGAVPRNTFCPSDACKTRADAGGLRTNVLAAGVGLRIDESHHGYGKAEPTGAPTNWMTVRRKTRENGMV